MERGTEERSAALQSDMSSDSITGCTGSIDRQANPQNIPFIRLPRQK
jgi:hypothetical protein